MNDYQNWKEEIDRRAVIDALKRAKEREDARTLRHIVTGVLVALVVVLAVSVILMGVK